MKKLIYAALIATVAVGGAISVNAQDRYLLGDPEPIDCTFTPDPSCAIILGLNDQTPVYDSPSGDNEEGVLADYTFTGE